MGLYGYAEALRVAIDAARAAREVLLVERRLAGGPRSPQGTSGTAEDAERLMRERLLLVHARSHTSAPAAEGA